MNRYLLDTNIVIYMLLGENDKLSRDVAYDVRDDSSQLYISTISVMELVYLYRAGRIDPKRKKFKTIESVIKTLENDFRITIKPFAKEHTRILVKLEIANLHNDPFDHAIISHAIT